MRIRIVRNIDEREPMSSALSKYIEKHGNHFSEKLSIYASKKMRNRNKILHYWTVDQVKTAIIDAGFKIPADINWHDMHYLANMAYADYFGSSLKTEADCLQWAVDFATDPDGYNYKAFTHYLADVMAVNEEIEWEEMI